MPINILHAVHYVLKFCHLYSKVLYVFVGGKNSYSHVKGSCPVQFPIKSMEKLLNISLGTGLGSNCTKTQIARDVGRPWKSMGVFGLGLHFAVANHTCRNRSSVLEK